MTSTETRVYEAAAYLNTAEECALYLQAAIEEADGDPAIIVTALEDIAKAKCMAKLAQTADFSSIGRAADNLSFAAVTKVCKSLGLKLHAEPIAPASV